MKRRTLLLTAVVFLFSLCAHAQSPAKTGIQFRDVQVGGVSYRYEIFVPASWTPKQKWPVILFLHGAGHRGSYPAGKQEFVLAPRFQSYHRQGRAVVVFPRCRAESWWTTPEMEEMALKALEQTIEEFHGDRSRIYLTGLSMGGYGVWSLASRHAGKFAAIAPICAGIQKLTVVPVPAVSEAADPYADVARRIGKTPVWIFHGAADDVIDVQESRRMERALKKAGGHVRYTEYPRLGHNAWDRAYAEPQFFPWLFSHRLPASR